MSETDNEAQTRRSIEAIADRAATKAVRDTLTLLGIDVTNPIRAQEEFARLRRVSAMMHDEERVKDLEFLNRLRAASEMIQDTGWKTVIRVCVTAGLGLALLVTKDYWISHIWKP
jgi:hypothetical protein